MLAGRSRAGWSEWHLQLLSQITSPSSVGIPTSVRRAERAQDKNMGYKGNPLFVKSFHAAVGLIEVTRHPQVQKEESFMASGQLLSPKSHSSNPRCHFGWQARSWNSKPRPWGAPPPSIPVFSGKNPQNSEDPRPGREYQTGQAERTRGTPDSLNRRDQNEPEKGIDGKEGPRPSLR